LERNGELGMGMNKKGIINIRKKRCALYRSKRVLVKVERGAKGKSGPHVS
jgi:hypothetical protein